MRISSDLATFLKGSSHQEIFLKFKSNLTGMYNLKGEQNPLRIDVKEFMLIY